MSDHDYKSRADSTDPTVSVTDEERRAGILRRFRPVASQIADSSGTNRLATSKTPKFSNKRLVWHGAESVTGSNPDTVPSDEIVHFDERVEVLEYEPLPPDTTELEERLTMGEILKAHQERRAQHRDAALAARAARRGSLCGSAAEIEAATLSEGPSLRPSDTGSKQPRSILKRSDTSHEHLTASPTSTAPHSQSSEAERHL